MALASIISQLIGNKHSAKQAALSRQHDWDKLFEQEAFTEQRDSKLADIGVESAGRKDRQGKELNLEFADRESDKKAWDTVKQAFAAKGIPPEQMQELFDQSKATHLAELTQKETEAGTAKTKSLQERDKSVALYPKEVQGLLTQQDTALDQANFLNTQQKAEGNQSLRRAGYQATLAKPAAEVSNLLRNSVSPGETFQRGTLKTSDFSQNFPAQEGHGDVESEVTKMMNIGGQQFPVKSKQYTPGGVKPVFSGKLSDLFQNGMEAPAYGPEQAQPSQLQAPSPTRSMPGRSSGGKSMDTTLPPEMLNAQPNPTEELVRKLLQRMYTEPKF